MLASVLARHTGQEEGEASRHLFQLLSLGLMKGNAALLLKQAMLAFIFSTGIKLLSNMSNDGNVLFSQVPTKMWHTNLKLKGVTLATKQE